MVFLCAKQASCLKVEGLHDELKELQQQHTMLEASLQQLRSAQVTRYKSGVRSLALLLLMQQHLLAPADGLL